MKEPIATISNLAYAAAAAVMAWHGTVYLAIAMAALAVASTLFHLRGSETGTTAHRLDEGAMYAVALAMLHHAIGLPDEVLVAAVIPLMIVFDNLRRVPSVPTLAVASVIVVAVVAYQAGWPVALAVMGIAGTGVAARVASEDRRLSASGKDWLHGMWHLNIALAISAAWWRLL